jgi:hypothetical protein
MTDRLKLREALKQLKAEQDITDADIASFSRVHPASVARFLSEPHYKPHRITLDKYRQFVALKGAQPKAG